MEGSILKFLKHRFACGVVVRVLLCVSAFTSCSVQEAGGGAAASSASPPADECFRFFRGLHLSNSLLSTKQPNKPVNPAAIKTYCNFKKLKIKRQRQKVGLKSPTRLAILDIRVSW